jgi:hypothetical protein
MREYRERPELRLLIMRHGKLSDASRAVGVSSACLYSILRGTASPGRKLAARLSDYVHQPVEELFPDLHKGITEVRSEQVVQYIRAHGRIARHDVAELCGISAYQTERLISHLVKRGALLARGKQRNRYYDVPPNTTSAPIVEPADSGTLFASIPKGDLEDLRDLARRWSREQGQRITLSALAGEAVREYLRKETA